MHGRRPRVAGRIRAPAHPAVHADPSASWSVVETALREIYGNNAGTLSFETTFRSAYLMVLQRAGTRLYSGTRNVVQQLVHDAAATRVIPLLPATKTPTISTNPNPNPNAASDSILVDDQENNSITHIEKEATLDSQTLKIAEQPGFQHLQQQTTDQQAIALLDALEKLWLHHTACREAYTAILMYVDRVHVEANGLPTIGEMVTDVFRDTVLLAADHRILNATITAVVLEIQHHRERETVPEVILKHIVEMLNALSTGETDQETGRNHTLYSRFLEPAIIDSTHNYYAAKYTKLMAQYDAPGYLRQVESRLEDENVRVKSYLCRETLPALLQTTVDELLEKHLSTITDSPDSGLCQLFDNVALQDLKLMYTLFAKAPNGLELMRNRLCTHIANECIKINVIGQIVDASLVKRQQHFNQVAMKLKPNSSSSNEQRRNSDILDNGADGNNDSNNDPKEKCYVNSANVNGEASNSGSSNDSTGNSIAQIPPGSSVATHWIRQMLGLKERIDLVVSMSFSGDNLFETVLYKELQEGINSHVRAPEFVSLFIDENLRKSFKEMSEEEIASVLTKTIDMFRFIKSKDIFERYYKQHLAKRLLFGRSVSEDSELSMIARLKVECGYQFTSKLEGMFNDMAISQELMNEFKQQQQQKQKQQNQTKESLPLAVSRSVSDESIATESSTSDVANSKDDISKVDLALDSKPKREIDKENVETRDKITHRPSSQYRDPELNVSVLTAIYWPVSTTENVTKETTFPASVSPIMKKFSDFYLAKHQGRLLTWLPHLGNADIRVNFDRGKKEINVSTYGMIVLMGAFSDLMDDEKISFAEIRKRLSGIGEVDLRRTLQSLALSRHKILLKNTKTKTVVDSDIFMFNRKFTSPNHKIRIPQVVGGGGGSAATDVGGDGDERSAIGQSNGGKVKNNISDGFSRGGVDSESDVVSMMGKIDESRKNQIEAAIVRIMKSRKSMEHSQLVSEVVRQMSSRFTPDPLMIKSRIEGLIEREYLQRDSDNRRMYTYLA